jgi:hypothetical protein
MNPEEFEKKPRNFVAKTRVSFKSLALFVRFLETRGLKPKTKSEVLSMAFEFLALQIKTRYPELKFETSSEAAEFLEDRGLASSENKKKAFEELREESLLDESESLLNDSEMLEASEIFKNIMKLKS